MRVKKLLVLGVLLFSCKSLFAEPVELKAKVDKSSITIGDRIKYEVSVEYDSGIEVEPFSPGKNLGEFEIKDYNVDLPKKTKSGRMLSRSLYTITTFTTGEFTIPGFKIKYKGVDNQEKEASSEEIKIKVEGIKPGPGDIDDVRPLKPPEDIKARIPVWVFIALILLTLGAAAFIYVKNRKKKEDEPAPPPRPAEDIAREALKKILEMRLVEKGMIKEYYIRISDVIRGYIENRYKIFAMDRTTWELLQEMRSKRLERLHVDRINDFLENCDMVKFAKYTPAAKEIEDVYKKAEEIIDVTTPKQALESLRGA